MLFGSSHERAQSAFICVNLRDLRFLPRYPDMPEDQKKLEASLPLVVLS
jgi:hypothetical protein